MGKTQKAAAWGPMDRKSRPKAEAKMRFLWRGSEPPPYQLGDQWFFHYFGHSKRHLLNEVNTEWIFTKSVPRGLSRQAGHASFVLECGSSYSSKCGRFVSAVWCLIAFTLEVYGFRHKSAEHVKNHEKSRKTQKFTSCVIRDFRLAPVMHMFGGNLCQNVIIYMHKWTTPLYGLPVTTAL